MGSGLCLLCRVLLAGMDGEGALLDGLVALTLFALHMPIVVATVVATAIAIMQRHSILQPRRIVVF